MMRQSIVPAVALAAVLAAAGPAPAQQAAATAQRDVSVEADQMEFIDAERKAIFTGNVDARRGDVKLTSDALSVLYHQPEQPGPGASQGGSSAAGGASAQTQPAPPEGAAGGISGASVTLLDARGNVVIVTPRERITGEWARIDVPKDMLTVGGDVTLTQGTTVLRGQKLDVNLKTNRTVMTGGRVKGQFVPQ